MAPIQKMSNADPTTKSADLIGENIERLKALFPEAFTEGKIDFEVLKQLLGGAMDEREEKFGLNWHGKRQARRLALTPSTGTLRPCPGESVNWDTTHNLMLEGDNLEVLKLLQKSYAGKVKLIYIDPPYNTGGDFVYPDDFQDNIKNYLMRTGQVDSDGRKNTTNTEASGRFHTDWLNMMYPRLRLAKNLLRPEGVIFVSIDDREVANARLLLGEVFGEENFEGHVHWRRRHNQPNDPTKMLALVAEHVLCFARDKVAYKAAGVGKIALTGEFSNPDNDPRDDWASKPWKVGSDQSGSRYPITLPSGRVCEEEWMGDQGTYESLLADKRIIFSNNGDGLPRKKYFKKEREAEGQCATNWWPHEQYGNNQAANSLLESLLGEKNIFSNPKPIELIKGVLDVGNAAKEKDIVLDFFAGSGTTAHAVIDRNAGSGSVQRYILVQLPEQLDAAKPDQEAAARFCDRIGKPRSIAELTKERLRRAGAKVQQENPVLAGDLGFRVFKLDSSNIRTWEPDRANVAEAVQQSIEHLKTDRTEQDILFELLLKLGLDLTVPIEEKKIAGKSVHSVGAGTLLACLATTITVAEVEPLALGIVKWRKELMPSGEITVVFRDSAFENDVAKSNLAAILEQNGLTTVRSV